MIVRRALGSVAVLIGLGVVVAGPAVASSATVRTGDNIESITVDDTAGVLNEARLRDALDDIDFHEPTKVAVYTREGEYSDNINTETLLHAREKHPEWISDDPADYGDYWDDGYFIITLSIEGPGDGQIGTYFGEDRAVSDGAMEKIHEAGYDDFNLSRWTDGVIAVADKGASIINRPWYQAPALWWSAGGAGVAASAVGGGVAITRSNRRAQFAAALAEGRRSLANVSTDLDETEISARTLPSGSRHAAELERRFGDFSAQYRSAFEEQKRLEAADKKDTGASEGVARAETFRDTAADLDFTDDAIIQAAALYTRSPSWEDAWRAQTAPLLEDLGAIDSLAAGAEDEATEAAAALTSFAAEANTEVSRIGTDLQTQAIDVDTALDQLADLRKRLTARLDEFASAQIKAYTKTKDEEQQMRSEMREARTEYERTNRRRSGSILDVTSASDLFWRVQAYTSGYDAGRSEVDQARSAAASSSSSSGISHGFSGGGGSFSGSGGSSRF